MHQPPASVFPGLSPIDMVRALLSRLQSGAALQGQLRMSSRLDRGRGTAVERCTLATVKKSSSQRRGPLESVA